MDDSNQSIRQFKVGDTIIRQGETGDSAYIIEEGRVEIILERAGKPPQRFGTRGPGTIIGEMSLVDNAPRTATVKAVEDCTLLEISRADFTRRLNNADPVLRMTTQVILTRYRDTLTRAEISGHNQSWPAAEAMELNYADESNALENIKLANEFKTGLQNGEVSLHYQPIIDMQERDIVGFEALMRWEHPERGFISPGIFIPIAEESGVILDASKFALHQSCKALRRIEDRTGRHKELFMSVNFSSHDFAADDFAGQAYETISASDIMASQVHVEITERLLMDQPENAKETLALCQKNGLSIAIDDFGTGYSSLSYLHYFPIDTLKIDRSFVCDMTKNESSMELVKSIIALGKNMKMKIIAEGVEEPEEAKALADLGCDMAQGYFFARPMPEFDATTFVAKVNKKKLEF